MFLFFLSGIINNLIIVNLVIKTWKEQQASGRGVGREIENGIEIKSEITEIKGSRTAPEQIEIRATEVETIGTGKETGVMAVKERGTASVIRTETVADAITARLPGVALTRKVKKKWSRRHSQENKRSSCKSYSGEQALSQVEVSVDKRKVLVKIETTLKRRSHKKRSLRSKRLRRSLSQPRMTLQLCLEICRKDLEVLKTKTTRVMLRKDAIKPLFRKESIASS